MTQYIVIRHGCNAANQSMTPEMVVGTIEAKNRKEAAAACAKFTCYVNQWLELRPASKCGKEMCREAFEADSADDHNYGYTPEREPVV